MIQSSFRLIADGGRNPPPLENSRIKRRFRKTRGLEAFEEQHKGGACLQAKRTLGAKYASKIPFKGIKERERFRGFNKIVVSAEADRVLVVAVCHIVHQLKPRLPVKVWIASVDSRRERI